jgi:hypothetical protein
MKLKRTICGLALSASIIGAAFLGDSMNINDRLIYPIVYRNTRSEIGFTETPFEMEKYIIVNRNGNIETYFGNKRTKEYYKVREDGRAGTLFEKLYYDSRDIYDSITLRLDKFFDFFLER